MPRYFFDIEDGADRPDEVGEELEGLSAARVAAVKLSGELLQNFPDRFWTVGQWNVSVRDDSGLILFVLHFYAQDSAAVPKRPSETQTLSSPLQPATASGTPSSPSRPADRPAAS